MRTIYFVIAHNVFIKVIALFLAVLTWSYIAGQLYNEVPKEIRGASTVVKISDKNVIIKELPVHVNLVGTANKKYQVVIDKIRIYPSECILSGPIEKVENITFMITEPISVENITKSIKHKNIKLKEIEGLEISQDQEFYVDIPLIRKR